METFSTLLTICAGNLPVPGEFPAQRPVTRSFDVFFDLRLNKRLSKRSWGWRYETLWRPLWRHCNETGVHQTPLCVLLVLEILCSSTKLTFVLTLIAWFVFHVFDCSLSVQHLRSFWVRLCLLWDYFVISTWWTQNGFKSAHGEHKNSRRLLALFCRDNTTSCYVFSIFGSAVTRGLTRPRDIVTGMKQCAQKRFDNDYMHKLWSYVYHLSTKFD